MAVGEIFLYAFLKVLFDNIPFQHGSIFYFIFCLLRQYVNFVCKTPYVSLAFLVGFYWPKFRRSHEGVCPKVKGILIIFVTLKESLVIYSSRHACDVA
jgi:hypothetical protein